MKLVVDNNVLFSIMNPKSVSSYLFSSIRVEFLAPEFVKSEFNKHKEDCLFKSKLSEHEFELRQDEVKENIKFFKSSEYKDFLEKSLNASTDLDDADFLALALSLSNRRFVRDTNNPSDFSVSIKAAIWSNDPHLKLQPLVRVFTTKELVERLLSGEI
ncbi:hypothetical protein CMO93_03140 [Candidatus Woesearchaeota archaeon]|nr:hypothetical protein [Candidatus Woesearchaeota archaeon]|tara:strand:- start:3646 stop:4119 length:474 start_codon:yes stop_codon:yes gene_type:complete